MIKALSKILAVICTICVVQIHAARLENEPAELIQPDGTKFSAFFSGDEFYHYCHDKAGYTIVQDEKGWYLYAQKQQNKLVPSVWAAGRDNPQLKNLTPNLGISKEEYLSRKAAWTPVGEAVKAPHTGPLNTLCIFIKFNDQDEFPTPRSVYDAKFNSLTEVSLKSYYREVSYNKLDITTHFFPECSNTTNVSYTDDHPRSYYTYYPSIAEARLREHTLIKNAVEAIAAQAAGVDFDMDDDGFADNLCLIIKGGTNGWADVGLWPHTGVADSYDIRINGARIFNYEMQFEGNINYRVLAHEMFHVLGAPDLYHYTNFPVSSVADWDIMESGSAHMGAYMKYRYANQEWISEIPEITQSGIYSLKPLYRSQNNCYKIRSPYTENEFFVLEYRKKAGLLESQVAGSGLLVYRINPSADNAYAPPDQVYIYRPDGTLNSSGSTSNAFFSANSGRTAINDFTTNPTSFLSDGTPGGLFISNIGSADSTITFNVSIPGCTVTSPADSAIYAAGENIAVNIQTLNKAFSKVEIYLNDQLSATLPSPPYNHNLVINEAGEYALMIKAYSDNGIVVAANRTVFISKDKPFVFFVTPKNNQQLTANQQFKVLARAGYPGHVLNGAEVYLDNQLQTTISQEPYQTFLNIQTPGIHTVKVKVFAGQIAGEAGITVNTGLFSLRESFEGSWPPAGWSVNTPVYGWYRTDKTGKTGSHSAAVRHYHAQGTAILETPQIALSNDEKIEFYWMDRDADITKVVGLDTTYFEIYADNQWQQLAFNSVSSEAGFQSDFVKESCSLTPFNGKTVKFRWRDVTNESIYSQGCILDDVVIGKGLTGIDQTGSIITDLQISSYPNPFNNSTVLKYFLAGENQTEITIYNIKGEKVQQLFAGRQTKGWHTVRFEAAGLNSGVYFCQVNTGNSTFYHRVLLLK